MLKNYILIAWRLMLRNKAFSFINIIGLSIGISCCVLLSLYIRDELSYDRHFQDADRIFRLTSTMKYFQGRESQLQRSSPAIGPTLLREFPEVEAQTRVVKDLSTVEHILKYEDDAFFVKNGYKVDSTFFNIFPYEFKEGNEQKALHGNWSLILSEALATKMFGNEPALNKLVGIPTYSNAGVYQVTGVIKNTSNRSHLDADFYISGLEDELSPITSWATGNFVFTYLKLKEGTDPGQFAAKLPAIMKQYGEEENKAMGREKILGLQPLQDAHLYSRHFDNDIELGTSGSITYVYITGVIGLLILLLASINFINLTTAKSAQRAREIGIRKTIGAVRFNLFLQFIAESMGFAFFAMLFAMVMCYYALSFFSSLVQKEMTLVGGNITFVLEAILGFTLVTGFLAGIYPSIVLSSFEVVKVLKGKQALFSSVSLRKTLIAVQFVISIVLVSCILIIQNQLNYLQDKPLGFEARKKLLVPLRTADAVSRYTEFKNIVEQIPGVEHVTATSNAPTTPPISDWNFFPKGSDPNNGVGHYIIQLDEDYLKLMNIRNVAGRDFIFPNDAITPSPGVPRKVIVNESSIQKMNIPIFNAVGSVIQFANSDNFFEIIGVVEDFHQYSLHKAISPIVFMANADSGSFRQAIVVLNDEDDTKVFHDVKQAWNKLIPDTPFEGEELLDTVQQQYANDRRVSKIAKYSTVLAILISAMGLYGLSIFIAERRTKEVGIRKALGASASSIFILLSKELVILMIASCVISLPISYYASNEWLQTFAYRITIGPIPFFLSIGISVIMVLVAISYESIKAALANPVKSLRSE